MRVYNPHSDRVLLPQLQKELNRYRFIKNFNVQTYLQAKAYLLNQYMKQCKLKSCIVAVSGGIDSACVLAIVNYAQQQENSPIEKIIAVLLPVFDNVGATGQESATARGVEVCQSQNIEPHIIALGKPHQVLKENTEGILNIEGQAWAQGQLVAHTRTPTLYYTATLLAQEDLPGIICGTTNRDEGLYLGYFGKASDGLVDIQLISDLHKSEVYQVAKYLGVPDSAINVSPTGDMYDGRLDEEVFGAPYDFVEYYMYFLSLEIEEQDKIITSFDKANKEQFMFFKHNLENMHRYNRHKYFGASPAVHLDVDRLTIPEGWKNNCSIDYPQDKPVLTQYFVNLTEPEALPDFFNQKHDIKLFEKEIYGQSIYEIDNLLSAQECEWILEQIEKEEWLLVGQYGSAKNFNSLVDKHGSLRKSWYHKEIAHILYQRIVGSIPTLEFHKQTTQMTAPHHIWNLVGVNPLLRFIRYHANHFLVPHYDYTYQYHAYKKTLKSLVIYLNDNEAQTRFLKDNFDNEMNKDYSDWKESVDNAEIIHTFKAQQGKAIIFPHRLLHDAPALSEDTHSKTIIRSDLIYEAPYFGHTLKI